VPGKHATFFLSLISTETRSSAWQTRDLFSHHHFTTRNTNLQGGPATVGYFKSINTYTITHQHHQHINPQHHLSHNKIKSQKKILKTTKQTKKVNLKQFFQHYLLVFLT